MRVEKFTRRSRKLVALLLVVLLFSPISIVRGQTLLRAVNGPAQEGAGFGQAMASLGDVNADGIPDFAVGAPFGAGVGQIFVISGANGAVLHTLTPNLDFSALFGWAIAGMGDVNRDGVPDFAVSAPTQSAGASFGRVFVFSGQDGASLFVIDNPAPVGDGFFGWAIASVGDLNGDGIRELVVGAPAHGLNGQGQAFVFSGVDGAWIRDLTDPALLAGAFFGGALAAGDVNGDGVDDIAVGAPEQNGSRGQVFIFNGVNGDRLGIVDNPTPQAGAIFGEALAIVGDVNGDGLGDLAVGAPGQNVSVGGLTVFRAGKVYVFVAGPSGMADHHLVTFDVPNPDDSVTSPGFTSFGRSLTVVGDYDGDGVPDIVVGSRDHDIPDLPDSPINSGAGVGKAYLFSGATGALLVTLPDQGNPAVPTNANSNFGYQVAMVENAGGTGERYLVVSAPGQNVNGAALGQVFQYAMPSGSGNPPPPANDTTPPTLSVPGPVVAEATSSTGALVNYPSPTATDNEDPAPVVSCLPASGSTFPLGSTPVTCRASDRSGNGASAGFQVTVRDSTPPDTRILLDASVVDGQGRRLKLGDSTLSSAITVDFVGTDAVGVTSYQCSWDGGSYSPCTSPLTRSGLGTGTHVFRVRALDARDNVDPSPATFEWTILSKGQAAKELKRSAKELELSRREKAKLTALLREIKERLNDRRRSNDKSVCDELGAVVKYMVKKEHAGVLTSAETAPLRQLAESLKVSIGCRARHGWHAGHRHR